VETKTKLTADPKTAVSPQVSIIIPTYNSALYLPQALETVLTQEPAGQIEVIVIDDGSTDNTTDVLAPFAAQIRYEYQENQGSAAARNRGLALALGEFVVFLDADDYFLPGKLEKQLAVMAENPDAGMVHSGWRLVTANDQPIRDVEPWRSAPDLNLRVWLLQKPIKLDAVLFRKVWLDKVGGMDPDLKQAHDVDLVFRLALAGCHAVWLPEVTVAYRQHARATTQNGRQQVASLHLVLDKFFSREDLPTMARRLEPTVRYYTAVWSAWYLFRTGALDRVNTELLIAQEQTTKSPITAAGEWASMFARWQIENGRSPAELKTVWPQFKKALAVSDDRWQRLKQLLDWWVQRWPLVEIPPYTEWQTLWDFTKAALPKSQAMHLPMETLLDWWVDVWGPYRSNDPMALEGLAKFRSLTARQIVELAQFMLTLEHGLATAEQIACFWRDVMVLSLVPANQSFLVTRLYLTAFGQAFLRQRWRQAWLGYVSAARQGVSWHTFKAWVSFIISSLGYWLRKTRR
jgi:glycosyltransferase involved in cell wall biosynthesis